MAVDLHIGSIETVIEAGPAGTQDRRAMIAEILAILQAEIARTEADKSSRAHDTTATARVFGRRV